MTILRLRRLPASLKRLIGEYVVVDGQGALINDSGTGTGDIWSADKIATAIAAGGGGSGDNDVVGGRLSVAGANQLDWEFYTSDQCLLNNGSGWTLVKLASEPSLYLTGGSATDPIGTDSAVAVDTLYDVYLKHVSATSATLHVRPWETMTAGSSARVTTAWSNLTDYVAGDLTVGSDSNYYCASQASGPGGVGAKDPISEASYWGNNGQLTDQPGLHREDGILVAGNTSDYIQYRYIGAFYAYNNAGTPELKDAQLTRLTANLYNTRCKLCSGGNSTAGTWTYATSSTWRELNNGTNNQHLVWVTAEPITRVPTAVAIDNKISSASYEMYTAPQINGSRQGPWSVNGGTARIARQGPVDCPALGIGYHTAYLEEYVTGGTGTMYGWNNNRVFLELTM